MATTALTYLPTLSDLLLGSVQASDIGHCFVEKLMTMTDTLRRGSVLDFKGQEISSDQPEDAYFVLITIPGSNGKEGITNGTKFMAVLAWRGATLAKRNMYLTDGEVTDEVVKVLEKRGLKVSTKVYNQDNSQGQVIPPSIPDVDLTAAELDPRVTYTNPSPHMYWRINGTLTEAGVNEWPVEYDHSTGQLMGRHESEPAATNLLPFSQGGNLDQSVWVSNNSTSISTAVGPNGSNVFNIPSTMNQVALYKDTPAPATFVVGPNGSVPAKMDWTRTVMQCNGVKDLRVYVGRQSTGTIFHLHAKVSLPDTGTYTCSFYRKLSDDDSSIAVGIAQVEKGNFATSPVMNAGQTPTTRSASSISVSRPDRAVSFVVNYTDGSSESYNFADGTDHYVLPHAPNNWGVRYMKSISFVAE